MLHTFGGVFASPKHGPEEVGVLEAMRSHSFNVMGATRTYWDFLFGYGLFVTIFLLFYALIFWQLGTIASTVPRIRPILAFLCMNFFAMAIISWKYFFLGPALTEVLIALCAGWAAVNSSTVRYETGIE